jgi:hypothetical protein
MRGSEVCNFMIQSGFSLWGGVYLNVSRAFLDLGERV